MARSEVNYIYDAEMAFRAPASEAVTSGGVVGAVPLDKLEKVRPSSQRNKLGAEAYDVIIAVESVETSGSETYTFTAEVGATGGAATKVGEVVVNQAGQYVLKLDAATIEKLDTDREELELNLAVSGTSPSIKYAAWLV